MIGDQLQLGRADQPVRDPVRVTHADVGLARTKRARGGGQDRRTRRQSVGFHAGLFSEVQFACESNGSLVDCMSDWRKWQSSLDRAGELAQTCRLSERVLRRVVAPSFEVIALGVRSYQL